MLRSILREILKFRGLAEFRTRTAYFACKGRSYTYAGSIRVGEPQRDGEKPSAKMNADEIPLVNTPCNPGIAHEPCRSRHTHASYMHNHPTARANAPFSPETDSFDAPFGTGARKEAGGNRAGV